MVHELGHFISAKKLGIKVEEFGFGLPPRIIGIKKGETIYSINWLPIGGFVRLFGEDREDETKKRKKRINKKAFYSRPIWQRSLVLTAGVTMNFLLAVFIISFLFTQGVMMATERIHIEKVLPDTPAAVVGLKEKDTIKELRIHPPAGGSTFKITSGEQLINTTREHLGEEIVLLVDRGGQEYSFPIVPRKDYPKDEGPMGIMISNYELVKYPIWQAPILGTKEAFVMSYRLAKGIGTTIWKMISFQSVSKDVAGPVGIAQLTGQAIKFGQYAVLELVGLLSLNLAIVNILPFPALDGGRLLFVLIEGTTGKKIRAKWERLIHQAGMIVLLGLIVLVTINDLVRIFVK
ncbi:M50 family metallopeptidase [Candidatus Microgenomates bacterium]|nr:M50 family metallopeptidase [Candidatus Microgenomates bacterium]